MKILVLCGDYWHHPQIAREGLSAFKAKEFTCDWIEDTRDWSPELMTMYPLVILTKSDNVSAEDGTGWMTDGVQAVFLDYVRQGNGLFAIHSGTAEYDQKLILLTLEQYLSGGGEAILKSNFDRRLVLEPFAQLRLLSRILSVQTKTIS